MKKSSNQFGKTIVVLILFGLVIIGGYIRLSEKNQNTSISSLSSTEVETLVKKDLDKNYPENPREVVKFYSKISKCLYNSEFKEKQIDTLSNQMRKLFDEELLTNNPLDSYKGKLKTEIADYKKAQRKILNYEIQNSGLIEYSKIKNQEYASIIASYTLKEKDTYKKTYEKFILRKSKNGEWKILGWGLTNKTDIIQ